MSLRVETRWGAAGLHLVLSVLIAAAALGLMLAIWYPGPLFEAAGGNELLMILVSVDVVIGPLITLAVYRRGKRGMRFDLTVIALLQAGALAYGAHIVYLARPAYIVFVKDRFEVAAAVEIEPEDYARAALEAYRAPPVGAPRYVYAVEPVEPKERNWLVEQALAGRDMQHFPKYWVPYEARVAEVLAKSWPLERVRREEPEQARIIDDWLKGSGIDESRLRYVLLRARRAWVAVLLDASSARPVKMLIIERI